MSNTHEERPLNPDTAASLGAVAVVSSSVGVGIAGVIIGDMALAGLALTGGPSLGMMVAPFLLAGSLGGAYAGV